MAVGVVAGEEGVFSPGGPEQRAADAAEGEVSTGVCPRRWRVGEGAAELADALAEGGIGEVEQPADFLAGVAGKGEEGGEAEGGREVGECGIACSSFDGRSLRSLLRMSRLGAVALAPACFAAFAAGGGAGVEGGAVAEDAGEPAASLGRGEVGATGFERGKKRGLQEIVGFLRPAREAAGLRVKVCEGARAGHGRRLAHRRDCGNGAVAGMGPGPGGV